METKIQLKHPTGKKAVRMDKVKYDWIKDVILGHLRTNKISNHAEMLQSINEDLKKRKTKFEGSVEWYMEWVKLDLEARKKIKRVSTKSPITFALAGKVAKS